MPALTPNRNVMRKVQQKREGTLPNTDASSHAWTYDELCALKSVPTHIIDDAPLLRQVAATAGGPACTVDDWERPVDIRFKAPGESEGFCEWKKAFEAAFPLPEDRDWVFSNIRIEVQSV